MAAVWAISAKNLLTYGFVNGLSKLVEKLVMWLGIVEWLPAKSIRLSLNIEWSFVSNYEFSIIN